MRRQGWEQRRQCCGATWQEIGQISYFWSSWLQGSYSIRKQLFGCMGCQRVKWDTDALRVMHENKWERVKVCKRRQMKTKTATKCHYSYQMNQAITICYRILLLWTFFCTDIFLNEDIVKQLHQFVLYYFKRNWSLVFIWQYTDFNWDVK